MTQKTQLRIKELREHLGYSINEFARLLGISSRTLRRYESGENYPNIATIEKIVLIGNVKASWLLDNDPVKDMHKKSKNSLPTEFPVLSTDEILCELENLEVYCRKQLEMGNCSYEDEWHYPIYALTQVINKINKGEL